jgi:hypothetical protein
MKVLLLAELFNELTVKLKRSMRHQFHFFLKPTQRIFPFILPVFKNRTQFIINKSMEIHLYSLNNFHELHQF